MNKEARVGLFILGAIIILFYMSINIGALRLFSNSYFIYKTYFDDVVGLEVKSPVKISGITVGWVESISLTDKGKAEVIIRVNRAHKLFKNSYTTITQDSLLGNKILEVDSGESSSGVLPPGGTLHMPGRSSASLSDILEGVKDITTSVQEVASSFNRVFSSSTGEEQMKKSLQDISMASQNVANFSIKLNEVLDQNKENLNQSALNLNSGINDFSKIMPTIRTGVDELKNNAEIVMNDAKIATKNASRAANSIRIVSEKVERGEGTVGKFIHDEEVYEGVKEAVGGLKTFVEKAKNLEILIDGHNEQFRRIDNSRGEVNITLKFKDDYFYIVQLTSDSFGKFSHKTLYRDYFQEDDRSTDDRFSHYSVIKNVDSSQTMSDYEKLRVAPKIKDTLVDRTGIRKGFQIAKRFDRTVFRVGMFEDTFGAAIDFDVPLKTDSLKWITTFEFFDFSGFNRLEEDRVHVRWANKTFIFKNLYTYFGFDDIFSKKSAAPFFGAGISFTDDDIKFLFYALMGKSGD